MRVKVIDPKSDLYGEVGDIIAQYSAERFTVEFYGFMDEEFSYEQLEETFWWDGTTINESIEDLFI